ncbi:MAG: hypothetical protein IPL78_30910 [Chloroflexi bacterium]|nr:hypothetical protein [Chloroflexota bacterium]
MRSYRHMLARLTRTEPWPQRLALVSTLREEGVTYSTLALATTVTTDAAASVCVVELNWHWPGLQPILSGVESPGRAGVLLGQATLDEALVATDRPNLMLLPAGVMPPEKRTFFARSEELKGVLDELCGRVDHLLLDIPAILATSDAIPWLHSAKAVVSSSNRASPPSKTANAPWTTSPTSMCWASF